MYTCVHIHFCFSVNAFVGQGRHQVFLPSPLHLNRDGGKTLSLNLHLTNWARLADQRLSHGCLGSECRSSCLSDKLIALCPAISQSPVFSLWLSYAVTAGPRKQTGNFKMWKESEKKCSVMQWGKLVDKQSLYTVCFKRTSTRLWHLKGKPLLWLRQVIVFPKY